MSEVYGLQKAICSQCGQEKFRFEMSESKNLKHLCKKCRTKLNRKYSYRDIPMPSTGHWQIAPNR